jgi:hypothetical protein
MRGNELMYGYIVVAELAVVAVINLTITHGKGAPTHSQTTVSLLGLVAAAILGLVLQTRNRLVCGFTAILAAYFVTLPKVPNSLALFHLLALAIPVAYALILAQRQRKAATAQQRSRPAGASRTPAQRRADAAERKQARRRGRSQPAPTGPQASRRYTPPKPKRPQR